MSRTLFWYVFKDLLRIFFLASGALAGIMSFGGLLRPIYEHGLDAGQVVQMLGYFMPAMTTYSLPIAALFATTIVYGRLSADNEVTAARAAGISHLSLAMPALVLGLTIALSSILFLCFVVPVFWLKIEHVLYSNLAELVASQIQRSHQIRFEHSKTPVTVFAQDAEVMPTDPSRPFDQVVRLIAPMIVTYDSSEKNRPPVPEEFYTARSATAVIRQSNDDANVTLSAALDRGMRFPRRATGTQRQTAQISVGSTHFGPIALPSPVRENTKFMDVFRLRALLDRPEFSLRIRDTLSEFVQAEQETAFLELLETALSAATGTYIFEAGDETYILQRGGAKPSVRKNRLELVVEEGAAPVSLVERRGGEVVLDVSAREVRIRCYPDLAEDRMDIRIDMIDCIVGAGGIRTPRPTFPREFGIRTPARFARIEQRTAKDYLLGAGTPASQQRLRREVLRLRNGIVSELNARASFGVSCVILVTVGCALGMMFRSGNFLSAFAVSAIPALISVALIVTGQHTCESVPKTLLPGDWNNPLHIGLGLIWSGNAVVAVIAVVLLWRLQRQ